VSDDIELFLQIARCACCRRAEDADNRLGYCNRAVCRRHAYAHDAEFREKRLAINNEWHARKRKADPEWAAKRREAKKLRMRAKRRNQQGT
jgi:hypothetical protein